MSEPRTQTLNVPGGRLVYDIRDAETSTRAPVLLMIGHPMDAQGFTTLAAHFRDRTVVTYDPRGVGRSEVEDRTQVRTPELHADDLHRLISALNAGPVDLFASSGGAINALALVARHPADVRTLVAHEPPVAPVLPDREQAEAVIKEIRATYERNGLGPAMAKFIVFTSLQGPIPADYLQLPAPNPADFGLSTTDDGSRNDSLLGASFVPITHYLPDFSALQAAPTRIVIAAGVESEGTMAQRAALAVAERLNQELVIFPSHHGGFLGGGNLATVATLTRSRRPCDKSSTRKVIPARARGSTEDRTARRRQEVAFPTEALRKTRRSPGCRIAPPRRVVTFGWPPAPGSVFKL